jgi:hypothetical protein
LVEVERIVSDMGLFSVRKMDRSEGRREDKVFTIIEEGRDSRRTRAPPRMGEQQPESSGSGVS